jgi:hypothetical protein
MSNYHAIALATAAFGSLLSDNLSDFFSGISITAKPPDVIESEMPAVRLNLFLYQIMPNIGYHDFDLPARNSSGELVKKPVLALNLYFLLTAYSNDTGLFQDIQPQQILAKAMMTIHENPILTRDRIHNVHSNNIIFLDPTVDANLEDDYLDTQIELVKISPHPLTFEEMSKIWSPFFQTHYRLSVGYLMTVILLDSKRNIKPGLPVQERKIQVLPFRYPVINKIEPQFVERKDDSIIKISGRNLSAGNVKILFSKDNGQLLYEPETANVSDNQILVNIPFELNAGINQVQIVHPLIVGQPLVEHGNWNISNVGVFVLVPRITNPSSKITKSKGDPLTLTIEPGVTKKQKVQIILGSDRLIDIKLDQNQNIYPLKDLEINIPSDLSVITPSELFLLRVRVDGADSLIRHDTDPNSPTFNQYLPAVEVMG